MALVKTSGICKAISDEMLMAYIEVGYKALHEPGYYGLFTKHGIMPISKASYSRFLELGGKAV